MSRIALLLPCPCHGLPSLVGRGPLLPAPSSQPALPPARHHPASFHTDPSGTYVKYDAKAIGSGSEGAQTALQESFR